MSKSITLFLDFDGVLHPFEHAIREANGSYFCCASRIERVLIDYPEVQIVISSAWREERSVEDLKNLLHPHAPLLAGMVIDKTPKLNDHFTVGSRLREAIHWLADNAPDAQWLALDDDIKIWDATNFKQVGVPKRYTAIDRLIACKDGFYADEEERLRQKLDALRAGQPLHIHPGVVCDECGSALGDGFEPSDATQGYCPICGDQFADVYPSGAFGTIRLNLAVED